MSRKLAPPAALLALALLSPLLACRSGKPAASPAPSTSYSDVPRVTLAYASPSTCGPLEPGHAYDAELYQYARRADALAAEIVRAAKVGTGDPARADAAERAFEERREELAGGWHALCGAVPDHVSDSSRELLRAKLSAAIYRVCTALPEGVVDADAKARLARVCAQFKGAIGQP